MESPGQQHVQHRITLYITKLYVKAELSKLYKEFFRAVGLMMEFALTNYGKTWRIYIIEKDANSSFHSTWTLI